MKTAIRVVWHIIRYTVATCVSTAMSAVLPVIIASTPIILSIAWVLLWVAMFLLYVLTGESIDMEIGHPLGIVLVPLLFSVFGIVSVSTALLLVVAFNVLVVLPVSLITEFICRHLSVRAILRLASFVIAGLLLGVAAVSIMVMIVSGQQTQTTPFALFGVAIILLLTCICTVFTSGFILTTMSLVKDKAVIFIVALKERSKVLRHSKYAKATQGKHISPDAM